MILIKLLTSKSIQLDHSSIILAPLPPTAEPPVLVSDEIASDVTPPSLTSEEENPNAFIEDSFVANDTTCSLELAPGRHFATKESFIASEYVTSPYLISLRSSLPVCEGGYTKSPGRWVAACKTCADAASCDLDAAVYLMDECRLKDYVGIGQSFRMSELQQCLSSRMIVAAGDSILRGPLVRMLTPFLTPDEVKYWPAHSFGSIKGGHGLLVYWDYVAKAGLQGHEVRDEQDPKDVLRHMVDNHVPREAWKDRRAIFVIGGTSSYSDEFSAWLDDCGNNTFGCPWRKSEGGMSASAVIKGPGIRGFGACGGKTELECWQYRYVDVEGRKRKESIDQGFGYLDIVNMTAALWSTLRPGDAKGCGCHFCVHANPGAENWRDRHFGAMCANLANLLANELCDGERSEF